MVLKLSHEQFNELLRLHMTVRVLEYSLVPWDGAAIITRCHGYQC